MDMVAPAYDCRQESEASLGYITSPCLKQSNLFKCSHEWAIYSGRWLLQQFSNAFLQHYKVTRKKEKALHLPLTRRYLICMFQEVTQFWASIQFSDYLYCLFPLGDYSTERWELSKTPKFSSPIFTQFWWTLTPDHLGSTSEVWLWARFPYT